MALQKWRRKFYQAFDLPDECPSCKASKDRLQKCEYTRNTVNKNTGEIIFPGFSTDCAYICLNCSFKWHDNTGINLFSMGISGKWFKTKQFEDARLYGETKETWTPYKTKE